MGKLFLANYILISTKKFSVRPAIVIIIFIRIFFHSLCDLGDNIMATIPTISSGVAGPLGAIHLPRLWSKLRLSEAGQLPADYPECGAGFDQMVLDGLGVDRDAAVAYVKENKATYNDFEGWVIEQRGGSISREEIHASNEAIRGYNHDDETRSGILSAAGKDDDGSILDAVNLNNLDDWTELHNTLS